MLKKPKNENYSATIVEIKKLIPLEKCDFVQAAIILGNHVIVSKETELGDIGLYFPLETQLSDQYAKMNNLYKKSEMNIDPTQKGYFEENRRIRCVKFRGHKSEGLFMPIGSLKFLFPGINPGSGYKTLWYPKDFSIAVGDTFDELNDIGICNKYVISRTQTPGTPDSKKNKTKKWESKLVENQFRFHQNTSMLYKNLHKINPEDLISMTYKIHGTSGISSYVLCKRKIPMREKIGSFFHNIYTNLTTFGKQNFRLETTEYDYLYSSRKLIKNGELLVSKTFEQHYNSLHTSSKKRYVEKYYLSKYNMKIPDDIYRDIFPLDNVGNSLFTIKYFESKLIGFENYLMNELNYKSKGYYGDDIWKIADNQLKEFLQKGMTFYYEIVGYLPSGGMIQKDYDYGYTDPTDDYPLIGFGPNKDRSGIPPYEKDIHYGIYIYRITQTNIDGKVFEFSAKQVQDWTHFRGLKAVPQLYYGKVRDFMNPEKGLNSAITFMTYITNPELWQQNLLESIKALYNEKDCYLCRNKVPEEGVVIRIEGLDFEAYKQKSNRFYEKETKLLDAGESNLEEEN
ncbi:MAG: hypothetical protein ACOH2V_01015 [Candidatus Saccharimonadaceae bacterium]